MSLTLLLAALLFRSFDDGLPRTGQWRHGFAVADMNGDGLPDLAFSSPRKQPGPPVIFLNRGNGKWSRWEGTRFPALPFDYGAVAAADFDGDGKQDLAIGSHYRGVTAVLGDGRGTFVASQDGMSFPSTPQGSSPFSSRAVVTTDWNRDGRIDVAALSDGPRPGVSGVQLGVTVYENLGSAWSPHRAEGSDVVHGDALAAGDVDGDGFADLVTASYVVNYRRLLRLGSDPQLQPRQVETSLPISIGRAADLHDFDGDGRDEIVIAYTSSTTPPRAVIDVLSLPGQVRTLWSDEASTVSAVAAGDLDGDGSAEVVAALNDGRLITFRGDGTRDAEIAVRDWRRGCAPFALEIADLDGDRREEIVVAFAGETRCSSGGGVEVWKTVYSNKRRSIRK